MYPYKANAVTNESGRVLTLPDIILKTEIIGDKLNIWNKELPKLKRGIVNDLLHSKNDKLNLIGRWLVNKNISLNRICKYGFYQGLSAVIFEDIVEIRIDADREIFTKNLFDD